MNRCTEVHELARRSEPAVFGAEGEFKRRWSAGLIAWCPATMLRVTRVCHALWSLALTTKNKPNNEIRTYHKPQE
jgi:hypothetical protein